MRSRWNVAAFIATLVISDPLLAREPDYLTPVSDEMTKLVALKPDKTPVEVYSQSHALIIAQSAYPGPPKGWPALPAVEPEAFQLTEALERHRFKVEVHKNLRSDEMTNVIDAFIRKRATIPDSRILVFVSGHGWRRSVQSTSMGFFMPIDAPPENIENAKTTLSRLGLPMGMFSAWARMPDPRSMLFVFDACFSGSVFDWPDPIDDSSSSGSPDPAVAPESELPDSGSLSLSTEPVAAAPEAFGPEARSYVLDRIRNKGRQFLTAGPSNKITSRDSYFAKTFIEILNGKLASRVNINFDYWTTGKELGEWLSQNLKDIYGARPNATSPVFDSLNQQFYKQGDIVFRRLDLPPTILLGASDGFENLKNIMVGDAFGASKAILNAADAVIDQNNAKLSLEKNVIAFNKELSSQLPFGQQKDSLSRAKNNVDDAQKELVVTERRARNARDSIAEKLSEDNNSLAQEAVTKVAEKNEAFANITLLDTPSAEIINSLQSQTEALSSDNDHDRDLARATLAQTIRGLPASHKTYVVETMLRSFSRKSYRYQLGVAVALGRQTERIRLVDKNIYRDIRRLLTSDDATLSSRVLEMVNVLQFPN